MSTNGMTSWAADLKDVAAIYPFQGAEVLMVILGLAFWIGFHVLQIRNEQREVKHEMQADPKGEWTKEAINRY
jgi:hypothetical protein